MSKKIPKNWNMFPLEEIADVEMGQSPSSTSYTELPKGFPFLQGNADFGARIPTPKIYCMEPTKICETDDILISVRAPVGDLNIADREYCIGRGLAAVRGKPAKVWQPFLFYELLSERRQLYRLMQGTTFEAVNSRDLQSILLMVPNSREEQKKIASIVQSVDYAICKTNELIEKYSKMKQGLMQDLLKGERSTLLGSLFAFEYGTGLPEERRTGEGYPVFGSNGIVGFHSEPLVKEPGIIIGRKGTAGAVTFSDTPFWAIDTTYYVRFKKEMDRKFSFYLLASLELNKLEVSTGVPGLNRNDAYRKHVVDIPIEKQIYVSRILSSMDKRIVSEQSYLEKLVRIKNGLMQDLLTGKVRVAG